MALRLKGLHSSPVAKATLCSRYTLPAFPPIAFTRARRSTAPSEPELTTMDLLIYLGGGLMLFALACAATAAADHL